MAQVGILAGEGHIGSSGGQIASSSPVELVRPANTTAYTAGDGIGVSLSVSGATNATPIVITCTNHGLSDGDPVTISGVGGNTNANGNYYAKETGYSNTTFALYSDFALTTPVAGNSNYTSGGAVARAWRFPNIARVLGGSGFLTKIVALSDNAADTAAIRAHIFKIPATLPPTIPLDNAVWSPAYADMANYSGYVDLSPLYAPGSSPTGSAAYAEWLGQLYAVANSGLRDFLIVCQNLTANTPVSGSKLTLKTAWLVD